LAEMEMQRKNQELIAAGALIPALGVQEKK
jgi:hypothetical protein